MSYKIILKFSALQSSINDLVSRISWFSSKHDITTMFDRNLSKDQKGKREGKVKVVASDLDCIVAKKESTTQR